jgi:non-haem dioxygenase in morphine synthesis N-terminal
MTHSQRFTLLPLAVQFLLVNISLASVFPILDLQLKDSEMSVALPTISLSNLIDDDPGSVESLYQAGTSNGFFYLDCRGSHGTDLLRQVEYMYEVAEQVFDLEFSEKMQFDLDVIGPAKIDGLGTSSCCGIALIPYRYKPAGRNTGVSAGKQDGFEIYLVFTLL